MEVGFGEGFAVVVVVVVVVVAEVFDSEPGLFPMIIGRFGSVVHFLIVLSSLTTLPANSMPRMHWLVLPLLTSQH
jgi:hypothetical protein